MSRAKNPHAHYFSWVVAYIDAEAVSKVTKELAKNRAYDEIEAYIPTVKVLKKTFKGKNTFEEVPLLFNYGFFKIPRKLAIHKNFLEGLKENISCIVSWVKDPHKIRPELNVKLGDRKFIPENEIPAATATSQEIAALVKDAFNFSAHSADDLARIAPGQVITLHGYPFDGVMATVIEINPKKEVVKVKIRIFDQMRDVDVSYDNVFFTLYHSKRYDDSISITTLAEGAIDKHQLKKYKDGEGK